MKIPPGQINLLLSWLWILLGFVFGMVLGLFFHGEIWLGGYASFKRRLYRLGHISFFGLGAVNLFFWLTVRTLPASSSLLPVASWTFVVGAITMPVCAVIMAHCPKAHMLFAVPVLCLIAGAVLTLTLVVQSGGPQTPDPAADASTSPAINHQLSTINFPTPFDSP